jgi:hypothetical protein
MSAGRSGRFAALGRVSRRVLVGACGLLLATACFPTPPATPPAPVSADGLPTVQINGVVWSQVTVGNTVYATGSFTMARPAGSPANTNQTSRQNLLAYNITNGQLISTFNYPLNARGLVVAASPDHSRVYVGGDFTTVDGVPHNRIAAFNAATGEPLPAFRASTNGRVKAISATNSSVYVGGAFTSANGVARGRLAAFNPTNGGLLGWAPTANADVAAMVVTPSLQKVVVGGSFTALDRSSVPGLGALNALTGAVVPWAANQKVQNSGVNAGITSLRTDGSRVYGTGFVFGPGGNLEGTFAADPDTGDINWIEDCHGDTYDTFASGFVLYAVSHAHFCGNIGAFPETTPRTFYRATAFTTYPTGTIAHNSIGGYHDWFGNPDPSQLTWYPTLTNGTFTGQNQAAWSVTGNANYISLGGEFPTVNSSPQQGLVRFAVRSIAPNKAGPRPAAGLTPTLTSPSSGRVVVAWQTTFDQDDRNLTYKVVRDNVTATPINTRVVSTSFWQRFALSFTDIGLKPASTHTYRIFAFDPHNNRIFGSTVSITVK